MKRPTSDETWLEVSEVIALRSRCHRAKHAAVIVDATGRIVSSGYNGPPEGFLIAPGGEYGDCRDWCRRAKDAVAGRPASANYDNCPSVHAETNAIAHADRTAVVGGTLYVNGACCMTCTKLVANSGVSRVVMKIKASQSYRDHEKTITFLMACGIDVETEFISDGSG